MFHFLLFPRRWELRPVCTETCREKRFPKVHVLDSRLRGNDGIQSIAALKMKQAGYDGNHGGRKSIQAPVFQTACYGFEAV